MSGWPEFIVSNTIVGNSIPVDQLARVIEIADSMRYDTVVRGPSRPGHVFVRFAPRRTRLEG